MKNLYLPKLFLLFFIALFIGCSKGGEPKPATVQVRYQGKNLSSVRAFITAMSVRRSDGTDRKHFVEALPNEVSQDRAFTPDPGSDVAVFAEFRNTTTQNPTPQDAVLEAQILINGQVIKTIRLDAATRIEQTPYLERGVWISVDEL